MAKTTFDYETGPDGPRLAVVAEEPNGAPDPKAERAKAQAVRQDVVSRRDAVVDAARTLDDLSPDGVRQHVTKRWAGRRPLEEADVESFASDARAQRVDDVADALDSRVRRGVLGRGAKHVRVDMPRGWTRQSLRAMAPEEIASLKTRLVGRGWAPKEVDKHLRTYRSILKSPEEDET